ncbi:MAG: hypothetical protein ACE149_00755 [Armatimonadota bacterium]
MAAPAIDDLSAPLTDDDKRLLTLAQRRLPIEPRPFRALGEAAGLTEDSVIARLRSLKDKGFVRKVGPVFEPAALGLASELGAARVAPDHLDRAGASVAAWPEVTHCYGREHEVNLWFAGVAPSPAWFASAAEQVARMPGVQGVWRLPTVRRFKIEVIFELTPVAPMHNATSRPHPDSSTPRLLDSPPFLRALQSDLPLSPEPFRELAEKNGLQQEHVIETLAALVGSGAIRRYGALVSHRRLGFTANAMLVMQAQQDRIEQAGARLAQSPHVSHCYQRPPFPGFPYNLYAMVHGRARGEVTAVAAQLAQSVGIGDWQALFSTAEYRKSAPDYAALIRAKGGRG